MPDKKNVFRRMFESVAEGRSRQARRYVDFYLADRGIGTPGSDADDASPRRKG